MAKGKWKKIGEVGVDSGQLMLVDPCYLDSEWQRKDFADYRAYIDDSGQTWQFIGLGQELKEDNGFNSYAELLPSGKTPQQHIEAGEWDKIPPLKDASFSYNGVCQTTLRGEHQMNYKLGHPGVAVAFHSGHGDGVYDVEARENEEGRIVEVRVRMD